MIINIYELCEYKIETYVNIMIINEYNYEYVNCHELNGMIVSCRFTEN